VSTGVIISRGANVMSALSSARKVEIRHQETNTLDTSTQAREKKRREKRHSDALRATQANKRGAKGNVEPRKVEESNDLAGIDENDSIGG
jgi:hypothetical protein